MKLDRIGKILSEGTLLSTYLQDAFYVVNFHAIVV